MVQQLPLSGQQEPLAGKFFMTAGANTHEVATDNVTLTANRPITASLNWQRANGIITVDVSFDDPDTPNVGDYYYSDGSWSTQLQTEKPLSVWFCHFRNGSCFRFSRKL